MYHNNLNVVSLLYISGNIRASYALLYSKLSESESKHYLLLFLLLPKLGRREYDLGFDEDEYFFISFFSSFSSSRVSVSLRSFWFFSFLFSSKRDSIFLIFDIHLATSITDFFHHFLEMLELSSYILFLLFLRSE